MLATGVCYLWYRISVAFDYIGCVFWTYGVFNFSNLEFFESLSTTTGFLFGSSAIVNSDSVCSV